MRFIVFMLLAALFVVAAPTQFAQGVPSPYCMGSCPTPTNTPAPTATYAPTDNSADYGNTTNNTYPDNSGYNNKIDSKNKITVPVNGGYDLPLDQGPQGLVNRLLDWAKSLSGGQSSYGNSYSSQGSTNTDYSSGNDPYNSKLDTPNKITVPVNGGYDFPLDQGPKGIINRGIDWAKTLTGGQNSYSNQNTYNDQGSNNYQGNPTDYSSGNDPYNSKLDTPNKITVPVNGGYDFPLDQGPQGLINRGVDWAKTLTGGQQSYGQNQGSYNQGTTKTPSLHDSSSSYNSGNYNSKLDTPNKITVPVNGGYDFPLDQGPQGLVNRGIDWAKTLMGGQSYAPTGTPDNNGSYY